MRRSCFKCCKYGKSIIMQANFSIGLYLTLWLFVFYGYRCIRSARNSRFSGICRLRKQIRLDYDNWSLIIGGFFFFCFFFLDEDTHVSGPTCRAQRPKKTRDPQLPLLRFRAVVRVPSGVTPVLRPRGEKLVKTVKNSFLGVAGRFESFFFSSPFRLFFIFSTHPVSPRLSVIAANTNR